MTQDTYTVPCVYPLKKHSASGITVSVPGSKSITNRALLLATLSGGKSILNGVLFSDDSRHFLSCIQKLGFDTTVDEKEKRICITGLSGKIPLSEASLFVGSAGTAARFLTAFLGTSKGIYHMDASRQMRRRPMAPLLTSLRELGCEIICTDTEGHFPFTLKGNGFGCEEIRVNIKNSSQFLSALLISACLAGHDMKIRVEGTHGMSYIQMTEKMMEQFGVKILHPSDDCFLIPGGQRYHALTYQIEPDVSAACYFYAMSALLGIPVLVRHVHFNCLQGDIEFLHILEKMGCTLKETTDGIVVLPPKDEKLHGVDVCMSACSDQAITLAAIAPFADSPTVIRGIGHIRFQESDRMSAIAAELQKMGITCKETATDLTIFPGTPLPCAIDTYDDHRMAMGFSLIGLRIPGIVIRDPMCCRKTFENYFEVLGNICKKLTI